MKPVTTFFRKNSVPKAQRVSSSPVQASPPLRLLKYAGKAAPITALIIATNLLTYLAIGPGVLSTRGARLPAQELYLIDKAAKHISDTHTFSEKVHEVAEKLDVPPEWLMAIMYSESRFHAGIKNHKGSGATGLIQFMPATARDMGTTTRELGHMPPEKQLNYVYKYFRNVRKKYGDFRSLTDCYLAVLYPRALNQDICYALYAKPSVAYRRNKGLDENKDGQVTISDISRRMQRLYPIAFAARLHQEGDMLAWDE